MRDVDSTIQGMFRGKIAQTMFSAARTVLRLACHLHLGYDLGEEPEKKHIFAASDFDVVEEFCKNDKQHEMTQKGKTTKVFFPRAMTDLNDKKPHPKL